MRKKIISVVSVILSATLLCSCGGVNEKTENNDSYYKLAYYDENDTELGYNNYLFYQNNYKDVGPDPSVVYGKGNDGKNHFYIFPTSTNWSFYAYRSDDMSNLQGVGTVFVPEDESWLGANWTTEKAANMWAPDVIYDPDADDGQGGKGLYYMFFTGTDYVRCKQGEWFFDNRTERESYQKMLADAEEMTDDAAIAALDYDNEDANAFAAKVDALCTEYGISNRNEADYLLSLYVAEKADAATKEEIADLARKTIVSIRSADMNKLNSSSNNVLSACVLTSKTLEGPFVQYTNDGLDGNRKIDITQPFLSHEDVYETLSEKYSISGGLLFVDLHAFVDPVTGDKYMYFNSNALAPHSVSSYGEIFVIKVGDKNSRWTDDWQWDTVKQVTRTGYFDMGENENSKITDERSDLGEEHINEGAYVIYNSDNGKYYLTMSKGSYTNNSYAVIQAVGDSPMGPFRKVSRADGGLLLQSETNWKHVTGPGHHSFIEYDGQLYIVYHTQDTPAGNGNRVIAMDAVNYVSNDGGQIVLYANGPSSTPQPRVDNDYRNIADKAEITADNESSTDCLKDGIIDCSHETDFVKNFVAESGVTTIKLSFGDYRTVRALMIYNSKDYETAFDCIRRIEFDFLSEKDGETVKGTAYIDNLQFNQSYFYELYGEKYILPAAAAIAEFEDIYVKEIRIVLNVRKTVKISEIAVLGK